MQIERLTVNLRHRTSWEAMELGMALVRRHAAAIWKPWFVLTWLVFIVINTLCVWIDQLWLAGFMMWWLKPVFDRIPLYVISRSAFGDIPRTTETLRMQWRWGWRSMLSYLTWRRLSPARTVFMPIELLEGGTRNQQRARRRALGLPVYFQASLLILLFVHFEVALLLGSYAGFFLFIPTEYQPSSILAVKEIFATPGGLPLWLLITMNAISWAVVTTLEPFFVGAGFGLYLNQRTQLEAWDVELAFRKLRKRLTSASPLLILLIAMMSAPFSDLHAQAPPRQTASEASAKKQALPTLETVFDRHYQDPTAFQQSIDRAFEDPALGGIETRRVWQRKSASDHSPEWTLPDMSGIGKFVSFATEWGLWILLGIAIVIALILLRRWLPWLKGSDAADEDDESPIDTQALLMPETLPDDIASTARRLWASGKQRQALALLYRASVETMSERADVLLPPGATEAQCLRASRRMPEVEDRNLFSHMVRIWEYAAYALRLPDEREFDTLVNDLKTRFEWSTS